MSERVALSELVTLRRERVHGHHDAAGIYVGLEHLDRTSPRILRSAPASASSSLNGMFRPGDVVFAKLRPELRKAAVADFEGYCSTDLLVLTPRAGTDPRFAAHVMRSEAIFAEAIATAVGTKMPRTSWDSLRRLEVFRPSLPEQQRIASALDAAQDAIGATNAVVAKLMRIQLALLSDRVELRTGWHSEPLEACVRDDAPITYGIVQAGPHVPDGVPYIRTGDMSGDRLRVTGLMRTSETIAAAYARSRVAPGDLVCSLRASVGTVHPVPPELEGANLTQGTARIAPAIDARYLLWALRSASVQRHFMRCTKGTTLPEITLADLRRLPIPLPPSATEQRKIADQLDEMEATLQAERALLAKLRKLERAMSHDLLSGLRRATS